MLDLVESEMMPRGTVKSVTVRDDSLVVTMGGMTLDQISAMFADIELSPIVQSVGLNIAETEKDQPSSILSFSVNIVLQKGDDAK